MNYDFDILVVGGGMVGATFACALAPTGLRIGMLEERVPNLSWPRAGFDNRVSAITRSTERVFRGVGAWQGMEARRVQPYRAMHVWDATGRGAIHFDAADLGEADLGHIIENEVIWGALLDRMAQHENIELLAPVKCDRLEMRADGVTVHLIDGRCLTTRLVVGADGSRSWVREQAGLQARGWSYDQTAVVATIAHSGSHQEACWQRFSPTGPLAFLPLPEGFSSIVWSTTPQQAEALIAADDAGFLRALQEAFGDALGCMEAVNGPRGAFPLILQHATDYVRDGVALIGNAAHTIHPLAGQGLNIGVSDAAALAEVLEAVHPDEIGAYRVLRRYERWRKGDNLAVMAAMDGFKRLFSNEVAPLVLVRNLGLTIADKIGPMKHLLMRRALGVGGDLPRLARTT